MSDITQRLSAFERSEALVAELPLVYDEQKKLAASKMARENPGQSLQATTLVHEAFARLVYSQTDQHWNSRGHFDATANEAMRLMFVDNAQRRQPLRSAGEFQKSESNNIPIVADNFRDDLIPHDEALTKLKASTATQLACPTCDTSWG